MTNLRTWGTGLSFILLPLIFVFGFASHPNLAQLAPPDYGDASAWIAEFNGNRLWAIGHTTVMWSNVPALVVFLGLMTLLREKAGTLSLIAGFLGLVGCLMLVADDEPDEDGKDAFIGSLERNSDALMIRCQ